MNALTGIVELALGRASGFARFAVSPHAFWNSVAVLMALPTLLALGIMGKVGAVVGVTLLFALLSALLIPAVVTYTCARVWDRESWWLRFAISYNYSRIALAAIYVGCLYVAVLFFSVSRQGPAMGGVVQLPLLAYTLWLDWFLIRRGLQVSPARAVMGVTAINIATFILVGLPLLFSLGFDAEHAEGTFN